MPQVNGTTGTVHQENRNRPQTQAESSNVNGDQQQTRQGHFDAKGDQQTADDEDDDFDLKPRAKAKKAQAIDSLAMLLFSHDHLDTILRDTELFEQFNSFLAIYRPQIAPVVVRYLETQKALKAVEYANAVAENVSPLPTDPAKKDNDVAARVEDSFQDMSKDALETLVSEALPAYITYKLIKVSTEILINDITGRQTPIMKGLVGGLSEVFCLTDPNQEDNPIIYASEEFYQMTGYSRDLVIGSNCRFLQGSKTERHSVRRLKEANERGEELSETLLNYKRDGRPFINILMIAPLHDNKGKVKYYIGAQVDASGLVEGGKGIGSFERLLSDIQAKQNSQNQTSGEKQSALSKLGELSQLFDLEETSIVAQRSRSSSKSGKESVQDGSRSQSKQRRVFNESSDADSDGETAAEKNNNQAWSLAQTDSSGKLPGIYQNYFLMRPSPSLKIVFVSPALRRFGNLVQSPLLSHVTAPPATLDGLKESFETGTPVTAKVLFSASGSGKESGRELNHKQSESKLEDVASKHTGRTTWISATPLLSDDDSVGVWMVVVVDGETLGSGPGNKRGDSLQGRSTPITSKSIPRSDSAVAVDDAGGAPDNSRSIDSTAGTPKPPQRTKLAAEAQDDTPAEDDPFDDLHVGASAATPDPELHTRADTEEETEPASPRTPTAHGRGGYFDRGDVADEEEGPRDIHESEQDHEVSQGQQMGVHGRREDEEDYEEDEEHGHHDEDEGDERVYNEQDRRGEDEDGRRESLGRLPQSRTDFTPGKGVYMDYLQHPGSGRRLTQANMGDFARDTGDGGKVEYGDDDDDAKTPFSID